MRASALECRLRFPLQLAIYAVGFWAPWERYGTVSLGGSTTWTALPTFLFRQHWCGFSSAARALLVLGTVLSIVAALLMAWTASDLDKPRIALADQPTGRTVVAAGPYRRMQNPLGLGVLCHTLALCLLMPPSGALLAVALMLILEMRLFGAVDAVWQERYGPAYEHYRRAVPRWLPAVTAQVPPLHDRQSWWQGALLAAMFLGTAGGYLVEGASYNGTLILRWTLIGLGIQLIWKAVRTRSPT